MSQQIEKIFRFTFEVYEIAQGRPCPVHVDPFEGTHEQMEAYLDEQLKGYVIHDCSYQQTEVNDLPSE